MAQWVKLCSAAEIPGEGKLAAAAAGELPVCLANVGGRLFAIADVCPHRQAPLHEGWLEDGKVVCPWHSWAFDPATGLADYPEGELVAAYPLRQVGDEIMVEVEAQ